MLESLTLLKIIVGLLGAICGSIICVLVWVIKVTEWKSGIDHFRRAIDLAAPVSSNDCMARRGAMDEQRAACQKHFTSEFGHGQVMLERLDKKLEEKEKIDEARYQSLIGILRG